jgi:preprotein translocase subunit SecF
MNITSIIALSVALIIIQSFSIVLQQIFTIILIGLGFDVLNTWITNVSILKWHMEEKNK